MGKLMILRPYGLAASSVPANANLSRVLTPDPKEAVFLTAGTHNINFDIGSVANVDTVFLGFTGSAAWSITYSVDGVNYSQWPGNPALRSDLVSPYLWSPVRHALAVLANPVLARYVTISATVAADFPIGLVVIGAKVQSFWGHEWGAGRPIEDTGTAERLFGGGFGINEGARVSGYQWTFGDLTDQEMLDLFALAKDRGTTRPVLVVEDPDQTVGLHERIHWGLLDRLDAYERTHLSNTRWNMRIRDWA
ncbi:MAG: hypothetical protein H0U52_00660 [Chloroflexi bacterium]|nr:hypothetical protein [Chloroflexota bacterium]